MFKQEKFVGIFLWGALFSGLASGGPCFDADPLAPVVMQPLRPEVLQSLNAGKSDLSGDMKFKGIDVTWAAVRGEVAKPLEQVLALLKDHNTTRSGRVSEMEVHPFQDPRYLEHDEVHFVVKPFLFIKVEWTEQWIYADLSKGALDKVLISYQKTEGTSHIEHLCGNYLLAKKTPLVTDVTIYEQAKATGRTASDTLGGIKGTLRALGEK